MVQKLVGRGSKMYKTISSYIQQCDNDALYELFEYVVAEMNRRKEKNEKNLTNDLQNNV